MDMVILGVPLLALVGFLFASYSIVANDVIQTLGTFLSSNAKRPWVLLWAYASAIIIAVMAYGWFAYDGDIAFGRLNRIPFPETGIQWWHVLPPLVLLLLTRFGIPVSTTFLVLTIFTLSGGAATEGVLGSMLVKSFIGYLVAFAAGIAVFLVIARFFRALGRPHERPADLAILVCGPVVLYRFPLGPVADAGSGQYLHLPAARDRGGRRWLGAGHLLPGPCRIRDAFDGGASRHHLRDARRRDFKK